MSSVLTAYLFLASLVPSTTYGYGELMCGDPGKAVSCGKGAWTASGMAFDPGIPQVALAVPSPLRIDAQRVWLRVPGGACKRVWLADKMAARWVGVRGFDLNPAALRLLTGREGPNWSGQVEVCP